jgi:hypothetical protein
MQELPSCNLTGDVPANHVRLDTHSTKQPQNGLTITHSCNDKNTFSVPIVKVETYGHWCSRHACDVGTGNAWGHAGVTLMLEPSLDVRRRPWYVAWPAAQVGSSDQQATSYSASLMLRSAIEWLARLAVRKPAKKKWRSCTRENACLLHVFNAFQQGPMCRAHVPGKLGLWLVVADAAELVGRPLLVWLVGSAGKLLAAGSGSWCIFEAAALHCNNRQ